MEQQAHSLRLAGGGGKWIGSNLEGETTAATKRIKIRDPNSVFLSQESSTHGLKSCDRQNLTDVAVIALNRVDVSPVVGALDLNRVASPGASEANATSQVPLLARGISTDLNAEEDVTSSVNPKLRDVSECGSNTGPAKDPLTRWKEMKQNGFLSSPHRGLLPGAGVASSSRAKIPVPKQQRPKKSSKSGFLPKKMETAKTDKFANIIAAPSGLLNGLNLGIINHVRNKKQVHSIIEALVRSGTIENGHSQLKQASHAKCVPKETMAAPDTGKKCHLGPSHGTGGFSDLSAGNKNFKLPIPTGQSGDRASVSNSTAIKEVKSLRTKVLSSSAKACEESSAFSNDASANTSSVSLLSTRAANVAAQWLELLNQDIKGRLSALRRSKKRVRSVVTTELPFLISKEFSTDQENVFCYTNGSSDGLANNTLASMHLARWSKLFDQMDKTLSEEEKQLESWLYDVREMQLRCDHGLQNVHLPGVGGTQHQAALEYSNRNEQADRSTKELAVRAAAASIYSTCNFLMPNENVPVALSRLCSAAKVVIPTAGASSIFNMVSFDRRTNLRTS